MQSFICIHNIIDIATHNKKPNAEPIVIPTIVPIDSLEGLSSSIPSLVTGTVLASASEKTVAELTVE